jgi:hypothetical protein
MKKKENQALFSQSLTKGELISEISHDPPLKPTTAIVVVSKL